MWIRLLHSRVGETFSQPRGAVVEVDDDEGERMIAGGLGEPASKPKAALAGADRSGPGADASHHKAVEAAIDAPRENASTRPSRSRGRKAKPPAGGEEPK